jgi:hypothetical protein
MIQQTRTNHSMFDAPVMEVNEDGSEFSHGKVKSQAQTGEKPLSQQEGHHHAESMPVSIHKESPLDHHQKAKEPVVLPPDDEDDIYSAD